MMQGRHTPKRGVSPRAAGLPSGLLPGLGFNAELSQAYALS